MAKKKTNKKHKRKQGKNIVVANPNASEPRLPDLVFNNRDFPLEIIDPVGDLLAEPVVVYIAPHPDEAETIRKLRERIEETGYKLIVHHSPLI